MIFRPRIIEIIDGSLQLKNGNRVFSSLEGENPGGSMKDHMVRGEIEDLLAKKLIPSGGGISEVSAGSTAMSLAHYCPEYGIKCVLFVPTGIAQEIVTNLQSKGADLHQEEMNVIYNIYDQFQKDHANLIAFNQLFDSRKRRHYHGFGSAVYRQLGAVDAVIGGVGTGHSLLGTAEGLGNPTVLTAEPSEHFKVSGIRNIVGSRYGDQDTLSPDEFDKRIIVQESDLHKSTILQTSQGPVHSGASFDLVLTAIRSFLQGRSNQKIFAIGAALKRVEAATLRRVS